MLPDMFGIPLLCTRTLSGSLSDNPGKLASMLFDNSDTPSDMALDTFDNPLLRIHIPVHKCPGTFDNPDLRTDNKVNTLSGNPDTPAYMVADMTHTPPQHTHTLPYNPSGNLDISLNM